MATAPAAGFSQTLNDAFQRYFDAWVRQDVTALDTVFDPNATYEIDPARRLTGIGAIQAYWSSNQKRQRQVRFGFKVIREDAATSSGTAAFSAEFFDLQHKKRLILGGLITVSLAGSRIAALEERYSTAYQTGLFQRVKYLLPVETKDALAIGWRSVTGGLKFLYRWFTSSAYVLMYIFYVFLIALTAETNFLEGKTIWGMKVDLFSSALEPGLANFINGCFAVGLVFQAIAGRVRRKREIESYPVARRGIDDLVIMERQMRDASSVTIVSGDFSFLSQSLELRRTLEHLAARKRLRFISTKSQNDVQTAARVSAGHSRIVQILLNNGAISFDCRADLKCSIVERTGVSAALFMYYSVEASCHRIAILQESGETIYVYKMLKELVGSLR